MKVAHTRHCTQAGRRWPLWSAGRAPSAAWSPPLFETAGNRRSAFSAAKAPIALKSGGDQAALGALPALQSRTAATVSSVSRRLQLGQLGGHGFGVAGGLDLVPDVDDPALGVNQDRRPQHAFRNLQKVFAIAADHFGPLGFTRSREKPEYVAPPNAFTRRMRVAGNVGILMMFAMHAVWAACPCHSDQSARESQHDKTSFRAESPY